MNDDLHPDGVDEELRRRFGGGAPAWSDPDVVLDAMRPRLQQARTRRRASFASAIAGVAVLVVVLAFAFGRVGGDDGSVRVPPASNGPVSTAPTTPTTPTTAPSGGAATPDTTPESVPTTTPETAPLTVPGTAPTATPSDSFSDFSSAGGNITVHVVGDHVTLAKTAPAAGYTSDVHDNGPSRVEVRFSNGTTEWRIRVDLVDGQLVPEISDHG